MGLFPFHKWEKTSQSGVYHSQFLSSTFGEIFIKIQTKIAKLLIHENLHTYVNDKMFHSHFYANFQEFYEGQLKQQICYSFILLILIF